MNELDMARLDVIIQINDAFMEQITKILAIHGEDPELAAILASSFTMSINQINKVAPGFTNYMIKMLEAENA